MRVAVLGEDVRVALAGDEGAEDGEPGLADDVTDDERQLPVHLDERLLHPPDIIAPGLDEDVATAEVGAQREDRPGEAEAAAQQADTVQLPQPLAVLDSALAAGAVLDVVGVDEQDFEAPGFEDLVDGDQ